VGAPISDPGDGSGVSPVSMWRRENPRSRATAGPDGSAYHANVNCYNNSGLEDGGYKDSGIGREQGRGRKGLEGYQEVKTVQLKFGKQ
jgi:acyl-CoA reductase-like NAD-dependent aldehyde dehydrogenase